jgi:hypothetical protein
MCILTLDFEMLKTDGRTDGWTDLTKLLLLPRGNKILKKNLLLKSFIKKSN